MICYVCGIKISEMNNLGLIKEKAEVESTFKYVFYYIIEINIAKWTGG